MTDESAARFRGRFLGQSARVLWEEELPRLDERRRWSGLTGNYLRVVTDSAGDLLGQEMDVVLEGLEGDGFRGSAIER